MEIIQNFNGRHGNYILPFYELHPFIQKVQSKTKIRSEGSFGGL